MRSVELFSGAGGLALGISQAGFTHVAVVERDHHACATIRANRARGVRYVADWPLYQTDVCDFSYAPFARGIELLAGGPPCQPFSLGGKHAGYNDKRDMFPQVVRATRELEPLAILVENVKGLLRPTFARYFQYILLQLSNPEVSRKPDESWSDHLMRLQQHEKHVHIGALSYQLNYKVLNAANYGIPQRRERVFIVGSRSDLNLDWTFPSPTHSHDALLWSQWVTEEYWDRHKIVEAQRPQPSREVVERVQQLRSSLFPPSEIPWLTVRDAITDLPGMANNEGESLVPNHKLQPGARAYHGHTGSPLDEPAKTLKAGDHGVPGGENMVLLPNGQVRYFTVRESARLQTFPDDYVFQGSWTESMRQVGNAVPVTLAYIVASAVHSRLEAALYKDGVA